MLVEPPTGVGDEDDVVVEWLDDCCVPVVLGGEAATVVGDDEVEPAVALMAVARSALDGAAMPRAVRNTLRAVSNCWKSSEGAGVLLSNWRSSNGSTPRVTLVRRLRGVVPRAVGICRAECEPKNRVMGLSLPWAREFRRRPAERGGQGPWRLSALHTSRQNGLAGNTPSLGIPRKPGTPGEGGNLWGGRAMQAIRLMVVFAQTLARPRVPVHGSAEQRPKY